MILTILAAQTAADQLLSAFQEDSEIALADVAVVLNGAPELSILLVVDCLELCDPGERLREAVALDVALEALGVLPAQIQVRPESDEAVDSLAGVWMEGLFVGVGW